MKDVFDRKKYSIKEPINPAISKPYLDPMPKADIVDSFKLVLGDVFHGMDRAQTPMSHELKKAYFMALSKAFLEFDPILLAEVRKKMKEKTPGLTDDEIDKIFYFKQEWLCSIVPRTVPPPSILYWRVRAVFASFGHLKSSKGIPLFNDESWKNANNVLKEVLKGNFSDPPGMSFYRQRVNSKGEPLYDPLGFALLDCCRGTNATECVHKQITTTFHNWQQGCAMSELLLAEFTNRYNQVIIYIVYMTICLSITDTHVVIFLCMYNL